MSCLSSEAAERAETVRDFVTIMNAQQDMMKKHALLSLLIFNTRWRVYYGTFGNLRCAPM